MTTKSGFVPCSLSSHNGDATAGHVFALLGRVAIDHERDQVRSHAGVVHQGVALCRGTIGGDGFALAPGFQQEGKKVILDLVGWPESPRNSRC